MTLDASGNFGLGVTPSAWGGAWKAYQYIGGSMASPNGNNNLILQNAYNDGTNYRYISTAAASSYQQSAGQHIWYTAPSGTAGNAITFTQAMTLTAAGRLLVGGTNDFGVLTARAGGNQNGVIQSYIINTGGFALSSINDAGTANQGIEFRYGGGQPCIFVYNGNLHATFNTAGNLVVPATYSNNVGAVRAMYVDASGNYGYNASVRASKTNIKPLSNVEWLYDLAPVSFNYRERGDDGEYTDIAKQDVHYGLIADDVETVNSDLCTYSMDGKIEGVRYDLLVPSLLKALQEIHAEIESLKQRIN
jgi:hypothetical protein